MRLSSAFLRLMLAVIMAAMFVLGVAATEEEEPEFYFDVTRYNSGWIISDSNDDGRTDYALKLNDRMQKDIEAMDFSHDGYMDNFYYYENDVLIRHELDTNGNQQVDLWVFMYRGVQVQGWERDTNHDGQADLYRSYE